MHFLTTSAILRLQPTLQPYLPSSPFSQERAVVSTLAGGTSPSFPGKAFLSGAICPSEEIAILTAGYSRGGGEEAGDSAEEGRGCCGTRGVGGGIGRGSKENETSRGSLSLETCP